MKRKLLLIAGLVLGHSLIDKEAKKLNKSYPVSLLRFFGAHTYHMII